MSHAQATSGKPAVRASDAERDQAAEILRTAYAEGRLTRAELDQRTGAAYAAKTRAAVALSHSVPIRVARTNSHAAADAVVALRRAPGGHHGAAANHKVAVGPGISAAHL